MTPFKGFTLIEVLKHLEAHPWSEIGAICAAPGWAWAAGYKMSDELVRLESLRIVRHRPGSSGPAWALCFPSAQEAIRATWRSGMFANVKISCRVDLNPGGGKHVGRCPACEAEIHCSAGELGNHVCAGCGSELHLVPRPGSIPAPPGRPADG